MDAPASRFAHDGFWTSPVLFDSATMAALSAQVDAIGIADAGERDMLNLPFCQILAARIRRHPAMTALLPADHVAVQCTYFEKSADKNWLVPLHQDLAIPVLGRVDHAQLRGWSEKADGLYTQPPPALMGQLTAVRLHIDDCNLQDGALRIVPGSHRHGRLDAARAAQLREKEGEHHCVLAAGAALLLKPLVLHASSKSTGTSRRRVLHFLFGPPAPGYGLQWKRAV